ncbi:MAG: DUF1249 domain-containing protein [Pseudomonadota bacterium]
MNDDMSPENLLRKADFRDLMELYAENYRQFCLLFDDLPLGNDYLISRVEDELPIYLQVTRRHRYTTEVRLTYFLENSVGRVVPDPDAHLRVYHDAQLAEATHCYPGTVSQPLFGALVSVADVKDHRWKMNRLLDKWLEFLIQQGHGLSTMRPASAKEWPVELAPVDLDLDRIGDQASSRNTLPGASRSSENN